MFIVTNKKEKAIWLTEDPFDKRSGVWHFYDNDEDYQYDLDLFKSKYSSKFLMTLAKLTKIVKGENPND